MYRIVILSITVIVDSSRSVDDEMGKCMRIFSPDTFRCCKKRLDVKLAEQFDLQHCQGYSNNPISCEAHFCIAKTKGYVTDDGSMDKTKFEEILTNDLSDNEDFIEAFRTDCIDGEINRYGPPEFCDFARMKNCVMMNYAETCPRWIEMGNCKGMSDLVEECTKVFE